LKFTKPGHIFIVIIKCNTHTEAFVNKLKILLVPDFTDFFHFSSDKAPLRVFSPVPSLTLYEGRVEIR
jgi:hypothetical protein